MKFTMRSFPAAWIVASVSILLAACVHAPAPSRQAPVFFPPPPEKPRVQYLGLLSSVEDIPSPRSQFADFILGEEPLKYKLAKPISAILVGSRVYVCDTVLNAVLVFDLAAQVPTHPLAGDAGSGKIRQPNSIDADAQGNLFVADKLRGAVLRYGPNEDFLGAWGRPGETQPVAVAAGQDGLYVSEMGAQKIEVWDKNSGGVLRSFGGKGNAAGQFNLPTNLALDSAGMIYVSDTGNFRVQKFSPDGKPVLKFGSLGNAFGQFAWPKGIDVDAEGRIYVADTRFANIQLFDPNGKLLLFFGGPGSDRGNLNLPAGLRVYPWPDIPWLSEKVAPGFKPDTLVLAVNQEGNPCVNFFAVGQPSP